MIPEALGATGSPGADDRPQRARKNPRSELSHLGNRVTPRGLSCKSNARRLAADLAIWRAVVHGRNDRQMLVTRAPRGGFLSARIRARGSAPRHRAWSTAARWYGRLRRHPAGSSWSPSATTTRSAASPTTRRPASGSPADRRGPIVAARSAAASVRASDGSAGGTSVPHSGAQRVAAMASPGHGSGGSTGASVPKANSAPAAARLASGNARAVREPIAWRIVSRSLRSWMGWTEAATPRRANRARSTGCMT